MTQEDIRKLYSQNEWMTTEDIIQKTGNSRSSVYQCLERMQKNGSVEKKRIKLEKCWFYVWKLVK